MLGQLGRRMAGRVAWAAALAMLWASGYFCLGYMGDGWRARDMATALDDRIPFIAWSVWPYLLSLQIPLIPLFLVQCPRHFQRTAVAYGAVIIASLAFFAAFPVSSIQLRTAADPIGANPLTSWALRELFAIDLPFNLFPSLHVSLCALAAFATARAAPRSGLVLFGLVSLVAISVCTVKQHFILDALGGFTLAGIANELIMQPNDPSEDTRPLYMLWRISVYFMFSVVYGFFVIAYLRE